MLVTRRPFRQAFLALLSAAPLPLLASAAKADTLQLGNTDNVTVNGTGTHGTYLGAPISNNTTTYYSTSIGTSCASVYNNAAFTLGDGGELQNSATDGSGIAIFNAGSATITGGSIDANSPGLFGLLDDSTGALTISGGTFSGSGEFALLLDKGSGATTISGGTFTAGSAPALLASGSGGSDIVVTGGSFSAVGGTDLETYPGDYIDVYGKFTGLTPGQTQTLPGGGATGSFFGTLENDSVGQTFSYNNGGVITLHELPEPSSVAVLVLGAFGLAGMRLRTKRRQTVALA